ncbi:hypothetical protein [uncultured Ramlibacter sp.]|uniref:hypothetical protein n=1 Tax=uncultured Ramlibacter sp. TaxID=260755 RepID=UPI002612CB8D|nr:hypothetical protein [uncultured Ramlibacter sp.]
MSLESTRPDRPSEAPRDKPQVDRGEHANLERPGAQFHPRAAGWQARHPISAWPSARP